MWCYGHLQAAGTLQDLCSKLGRAPGLEKQTGWRSSFQERALGGPESSIQARLGGRPTSSCQAVGYLLEAVSQKLLVLRVAEVNNVLPQELLAQERDTRWKPPQLLPNLQAKRPPQEKGGVSAGPEAASFFSEFAWG